MAQASGGIRDELERRRDRALAVVAGVFILATALLMAVVIREALSSLRPMTFKELVAETLGRATPERTPDPVLIMSMWIGIAFLGLGAIYFRRAKFNPVRLQAVAGLGGVAGLLRTLQKTTVSVALMGAAIAALGFVSSLLTGLFGDMLRAWLISAVVLGYAYPRRGAWRRVVESADDLGAEADPAAKGTFA